MDRIRFFTFVLLLTFFLFPSFPEQGNVLAQEGGEKNVNFRWAFGAIVGQENDKRLVAITRDTILKSGDKIKMMVALKQMCFLYVFYQSEDGILSLLFPYDLKQFGTDYETDKKYYIPQGNKWFELDEQVGLEKFHLLASAKRLTDLETLYNEYGEKEIREKQKLFKHFLAKIREIKRKNQTLSTAAERPVQIGGTMRSSTKEKNNIFPDLDPIAAEVSASKFYSRTFTIEHQ